MKEAIIYTRFSPRPEKYKVKIVNGKVHKQVVDCLSAEFQELKCRDYCALYDMDVIAVYKDLAISGKSTENRPGFDEAVRHVCRIRGVLVVYDLDRFSRSMKDIIDTSIILDKHHANLAIITLSIDTSNPAGRVVFHILAALGQYMRESSALKTKMRMLDMQSSGIRVSNNPPYGWSVDPNNESRIVKNKQEQGVIELIVRLHQRGLNYNEIGRHLMSKGFNPRTAPAWDGKLISKILRRELPTDETLKRKYKKGIY